MIFKRKQARPASVGQICTIKTEVSSKMRQTENYLQNSASYKARSIGGYITSRSIEKNREQNKVMIADSTLVYISSVSVFNGLVNVIPLSIENDSSAGHGIRKIGNGFKSFLMKLDSLSLTSQENINEESGEYYPSVRDRLSNHIITHIDNDFSWENR